MSNNNKIPKITAYIKEKRSVSSNDLVNYLAISRQAINKYVKKLILSGQLLKEGTTKGVTYRLAGNTSSAIKFNRNYILKNINEDRVFDEMALFLNLKKQLKPNVFEIINYAFSELLNNAIEHSHSKKCLIYAEIDTYNFKFKVKDSGIGVFYSIFKKFTLNDENDALGELIKGKTTTMEGKHSGEGIFFSSKSGDKILFNSHKINLTFDNIENDVFVKEIRNLKGTEVNFIIKRNSRRELNKLFDQYAPKEFDYQFERTKVFVKLFQKEYVSRSEARRLLNGLNKFKEIILDFKDVNAIGQGFSDEIFRVFKTNYPLISIKTENVNPVVSAMIKHVK